MINLLPPDVKTSYSYARHNVKLRSWVVMCVIALVGLAAITTYGLLTIHQATVNYNHKIAAAQAKLKQEDFAGTQKQAQDISNGFKLTVQVLSREVLFSALIQKIGSTIPDNARLTSLTLDQPQGGIDITAKAVDYKTATQVQVNLSDPNNRIFSKADIIGVNCGGTSGLTPDKNYPCIISIRALFATNNPFLFINQNEAKP